jgi:hypothetical protein
VLAFPYMGPLHLNLPSLFTARAVEGSRFSGRYGFIESIGSCICIEHFNNFACSLHSRCVPRQEELR